MVLGFAMAAVVLAQGGRIDGMQARRILEASRAADYWVFYQVHTRLVSDTSIVTSSGRRRVQLEAFQEACRRDLTNAAYEQVCDAYGITKKQFNAIVRNPERAMAFPHVPDARVRRLLNRQLSPWEMKGTLFDPKGVRMKESLARRYGYINPRKPEPQPKEEITLEQLIGPSPLPKRFTEPAEPKADEPDVMRGESNVSPAVARDFLERKERFIKENRYVPPPGSARTLPSALD